MERTVIVFIMLLLVNEWACTPKTVVNTSASQQAQAGHGPPPWAPAHGYRAKHRFYYFTDIEVYFDLKVGMYIFWDGIKVKWTYATKLPESKFGKFDAAAANKVEIDDYEEEYIYKYHEKYKKKFPKGSGQPDSSVTPDHGNEKGKGKGKGQGKGKNK